MKAKQITTYHANGEAYTYEQELEVRMEANEPKMVEANIVNLYPDFTFQTIEGFGGAMTESSSYLLSLMDEETQQKALAEYFGPDGMGTRFIRVPIDSCDYSLEEYQAVADPIADPKLTTFTIDRDRKYILPMLKKAIAMSSIPLSVMLSPWSPPYQWKTTGAYGKNDTEVYGKQGEDLVEAMPGRCNGGSLKPEYYEPWAKYVVKYIQAYLKEGIPVTMLTPQNETVASTPWDSCVWTPEEAKTYLKDYLYPEMKKAGLTKQVGIYVWDHNKDRLIEHVEKVLDEEILDMVAGIAFHWYSGDHFEAVEMMKQKYQDKTFILSECCGLHEPGRTGINQTFGSSNFTKPETVDYIDACAYAHDIIGNLNAGMNRWIDWNLFVDEQGGPRHVPYGFTSGLIVAENGTYRKPLMHHYIGHFSRYIAVGAVRIGLSRSNDNVEVSAVRNPDDTYIIVMLNQKKEDKGCYLRIKGSITRINLPAETISTIVLS